MRGSEVADETNLGLELVAESFTHRSLRMRDDCAYVCRCRRPKIYKNVRVDVRDLCVADAKPFEAALIDESSGTRPKDGRQPGRLSHYQSPLDNCPVHLSLRVIPNA